MGKIYYKNQEYTGSNGGGGGDVPSSAVPTANTISKFDNSAKMNSTDMTSTEITNFVNSLDAQGANLVDYVVEQGTSGSWTYRKWQSGIAECWEMVNAGSKAMTTQEGYGYYASVSGYAFPSGLFISTPTVTIGDDMQGVLGGFSITSVNTTQVSGYWWCTRSITKTVYLSIQAKGRWK